MNNDIVLLNLRISMWGVSRTLSEQQYAVEADRTLVRATKKILECPEYEYLMTIKRAIHRNIHSLALPGNVLRSGIYPISAAMVSRVDDALEDFNVRWAVGVQGLGQVWDLRIKEVSERLGDIYNEDDYPSWERVQTCFQVKWNYFTTTTPGAGVLGNRISMREQAKAAEDWRAMMDEIRDGLRFAFKELIDAMVERLTPNADGTKKRLVGVEKLMDFVDMFSAKNVAQDEQLKDLVDDVRSLLEGTSVGQLRSDRSAREFVQERMESVKVILDTMVEDAPSRQIVLRD